MRKMLLASAFLAAATVPGATQTLELQVLDGSTVVDTVSSSSGNLNLNTSDANFSTISATVVGVPQIANPDLSSVTLNVKSATAGSHTLTINILQTGVSAAAGTKLSTTGTTNDLIGAPGPTVETSYFNGTSITSLGTMLAQHSFPAGDVSDHFGPIVSLLGSALTSDAQSYAITFTAAGQSSNDSIQIKTAIPEPSTWAMLLGGFAFIALVGWRKAKWPRTLEV